MAPTKLVPAHLRWHDDQPFSDTYGDIYHAPDGADEVARVLLRPGAIPERLARASRFRIGELGFGTGLNFIVAAEASLAAATPLHFVSFEVAPIAPADFDRMADRRARRHPLYAELARNYPPLIRGWHQRHLAGGRICLNLFWGDAAEGIGELEVLQRNPLDAWFLDGFAPDRNPELWSDPLFEGIARLSDSGTTVATFTSAGRVRRGLQRVGFTMRRVDQRPHKSESLAGSFAAQGLERVSAPRHAVVIGAGLAGASAARHLAEAGVRVTVHDPRPPARNPAAASPGEDGGQYRDRVRDQVQGEDRDEEQGEGWRVDGALPLPGSAIPTTVLHGRLVADSGPAGSLRCHAFLYAAAWAARFAGFTATGVLQLPAGSAGSAATADGEARLAAIDATWGASGPWLQRLSTAAAQLRTGWPVDSGGLWFPGGGGVDTPRLCAALLEHPDIEVVAAERPLPAGPSTDGVPVVLACGIATLGAAPARYLELAPVLGQLDFVSVDKLPLAPIVGNGYLAPGRGLLAVGATYEYRPWEPARATATNLAQLEGHAFTWRRRARGTRTTTSDRSAVAGPLYDAEGQSLAPLYASAGHGSMGNVSSHFAAALIAGQICGDAPPMSPALVAALSPLRFRERQRRRGYRHGAGE